MSTVNRLFLVGRLGADPELRTAASGQPWCRMSVATNRNKKEGDQWVEETDWHRVTAFGNLADRCVRYLRKGSLVAVEGTLTYVKFIGDDGKPVTLARVRASRVLFLDRPRSASRSEPAQAAAPVPQPDAVPAEQPAEDIPF